MVGTIRHSDDYHATQLAAINFFEPSSCGRGPMMTVGDANFRSFGVVPKDLHIKYRHRVKRMQIAQTLDISNRSSLHSRNSKKLRYSYSYFPYLGNRRCRVPPM
jgi:hypothetical protein